MTGSDEKVLWTCSPLQDDPIDNAVLLGLGDRVKSLYSFLNADELITPLIIAINGDWGSGKTSLIFTLKRMIDENTKNKNITVCFDAWKYEYSDPALGLFSIIAHKLGSSKKTLIGKGKKVAELAVDIFARHYTGMGLKEVKEQLRDSISSVEDLSIKFASLVKESSNNKKIIVFIDDLDRCLPENVLKILDSLKLFLNISNFVFVVAVDISKIKLA
jgi:predicted KAP-like P-loop ATPase